MIRVALLGAALLAPFASGQLATSTNFQLHDASFGVTGGGGSSLGNTGYVTQAPLAGGQVTSTGFRADYGFVGANDLDLGSGPVLWGVVPARGHRDGGTAITFYGCHFDHTTTAEIGGAAVTGMSLVSQTVVTGTTTFGPQGRQPVSITTLVGSESHPEAFLYTPAVTTSPLVVSGAILRLKAYGDPANAFHALVATTKTDPPMTQQTGLLLIGPDNVLPILINQPYGPDGERSFDFEIPNIASLTGITLYFQNVDVNGIYFAELTNRGDVTFF